METSNAIWQKLKTQSELSGKPILALAPMADVTDPAFRRIVIKYSRYGGHDIGDGSTKSLPDETFRVGGPDVLWTEFVSADGLCHESGREALIKDLAFTQAERPIIAQLFSSNPDNMRSAAKLCAELGFDGIDINMGCPDKTIEKQGCGSAMIKTPEIAGQIIQSAKDGIADAGKDIPVSVKTRIGYNKNEIETWIPFLLRQNISALTVHLRTRKEMSSVPAHWDFMSQIVEIRNEISPSTIILGNGDVTDIQDAYTKARETGCDGIMIGRAIFGNPFLFSEGEKETHAQKKSLFAKGLNVIRPFLLKIGLMKKDRYWLRVESTVSLSEKLSVMVEHATLFAELLPHKNFSIMKKHFKAYAHGFSGAKELRMKLMETHTVSEIQDTVDNFLSKK
jgi:tRNA-dihydrouridine synthase